LRKAVVPAVSGRGTVTLMFHWAGPHVSRFRNSWGVKFVALSVSVLTIQCGTSTGMPKS
jgi:hypothetical protein